MKGFKRLLVLSIYNLVVMSILTFYGLGLLLSLRVKRFAGWLDRFKVGQVVRAKLDRRSSIWLHAASVGEIMQAIPLLKSILKKHPGYNIVVTTCTNTSSAVVEQELGNQVTYLKLRWDLSWVASNFIKKYNVKLALFIEADFWLAHLNALKGKGIPTLLINGRMSYKSYDRWAKAKYFITLVLDCFSFLSADSLHSQQRLQEFSSAKEVYYFGNLKTSSHDNKVDMSLVKVLEHTLKDKVVLLGVSTHEREHLMLAEVHAELKQSIPNLITLILPRHIDKMKAVHKEIYRVGLKTCIFSRKFLPTARAELWLVELMGRVPTLCALADVIYMGKSMFPENAGGQNLLEPLRQNKPVLFGPYMDNFADLAKKAVAAGAAIECKDQSDLCEQIKQVLTDPQRKASMGQASSRLTESFASVQEEYLEVIESYLDKNI